MDVYLYFHLDEEQWSADSPDIPGFMAVGDSLHELREIARAAVLDILQAHLGVAPGDVRIHEDLADNGEGTNAGDPGGTTNDSVPTSGASAERRVVVGSAA